MVLLWTCGDVFKTTYFYVRKTPPQFVICGLLQVMVDIAILTQVWLYYENTTKKKKSQHMHFWQDEENGELLEELLHNSNCTEGGGEEDIDVP